METDSPRLAFGKTIGIGWIKNALYRLMEVKGYFFRFRCAYAFLLSRYF